jgi:hypothetical protein
MNGIRIPTRAEASYSLDSGEFSYFHGKVTELEYNASMPY